MVTKKRIWWPTRIKEHDMMIWKYNIITKKKLIQELPKRDNSSLWSAWGLRMNLKWFIQRRINCISRPLSRAGGFSICSLISSRAEKMAEGAQNWWDWWLASWLCFCRCRRSGHGLVFGGKKGVHRHPQAVPLPGTRQIRALRQANRHPQPLIWPDRRSRMNQRQ